MAEDRTSYHYVFALICIAKVLKNPQKPSKTVRKKKRGREKTASFKT